MHIVDGEIVTDDKHAISAEKARALANYRMAQGDVVLGRRGEMGRCAIVRSAHHGFLCGTGSLLLRPGPLLSAEYLRLLLSSKAMVRTMELASLGTTMPNLNQSIVANLRVPLPPPDEQCRIAGILDRAADLRELRRTVTNRSTELPAAIFLEMFGDPGTAPLGDSAPLDELVSFCSGATPSKANPAYWQGDVPWFSPKDLKSAVLLDSIDHISESVISSTSLKAIPPGTVLIVVRGMILAHTVPISIVETRCTINQDLKALIPRVEIEPVFLHTALTVQYARILGCVSTAAHGTKRIEIQDLKRIRIPRPGPVAEKEFAKRVERAASVARSAATQDAAIDELFSALQTRAFSGEL